MSRFFVTGASASAGGILTLSGENARHALTVLRLGLGDPLTICDGAGTDYVCDVERTGKNELCARVLEVLPNDREPRVRVHLFTSLIKADKLEYAVQKAVELGVHAVYPFTSEHSVARAGGNAAEKTARLAKIAENAAKQCGRGIIPVISEPLAFDEAIAAVKAINPCLALVAHERGAVPLKTRLKDAAADNIALFIGPEGGFSQREIDRLTENGIKEFILGRRVLRAETAAIAALACVQYEYE